jgi:hypothetical protein
MPKLGLQNNYAERTGTSFNLAAALAWLLTLLTCGFLVKYVEIRGFLIEHGLNFLPGNFIGIEIWFVSLPGWIAAAVLYAVLSKLMQQRVRT